MHLPIFYPTFLPFFTELPHRFQTKAYAVERVKYLDTHDDAYIQMLMECPLHDQEQLVKRYSELEQWLVGICSRSPEEGLRRIYDFCANNHESYLREYSQIAKRRNQRKVWLGGIKKQIRKFFHMF